MSEPNPFSIPDLPGDSRDPLEETDNLRQLLQNQKQELQSIITSVDEKISKPGLRGGFNVDDVKSYGTLANAIAAIPSTQSKTIYITEPQYLAANMTVPSNISIIVLKGGSFTGAYTVTFSGPFEAGLFTVFTGSITARFGVGSVNEYYYPEWWGAKGDNATVNTTPIQAAIDAVSATVAGSATGGGVVYFSTGIYLTSSLSIPTQFITLKGAGDSASEIRSTGSGTDLIHFLGSATWGVVINFQSSIQDIKIQCITGTWTYLLHLEAISEFRMSRVWVESGGTATAAMCVESCINLTFADCVFRGGSYCVDMFKRYPTDGSSANAPPNNITFRDCEFKTSLIFGLRSRNGTGIKIIGGDFSVNGQEGGGTSDENHGAVFIDRGSEFEGGGLAAVLDGVWFEANWGCHIKVGKMYYTPVSVIILNCKGVNANAKYGVWCATTSPDISRCYIDGCNFSNATTADYYISNAGSAVIMKSTGASLGGNSLGLLALPAPHAQTYSYVLPHWVTYVDNGISTITSYSLDVGSGGPYIAVTLTAPGTIRNIINWPATGASMITIFAVNHPLTFIHRYYGSAIDDIFLFGAADYTLPAGETITFARFSTKWIMMSTSYSPMIPGAYIFQTTPYHLSFNTTDGSDNGQLDITGGGGGGNNVNRGAYLELRGNENLGVARLAAGDNSSTGTVVLATGADVDRLTVDTDGFVRVSGSLYAPYINPKTNDGSDTGRIVLSGGGAGGDVARGGFISLRGNENGSPGELRLSAGDVAGAVLTLATGNDVARISIARDGVVTINDVDFTIGTTTGTKIGTSTSQKLALWNKTPIVQPAHANQAAVSAQTQETLTDSTTGTANTTVQDVTAAHDQTILNNNFADLIAQLAKIKTDIANIKTFQDQNRTDQIAVGVIKGSA